MMQAKLRTLAKVTLAAVFSVASASAIITTQAIHPAQVGDASGNPLAATSQPASAQGDRHYRRGWYAWHGRYWQHRHWHAGYWGPYHRWHPGFWVYF